MNVREFFHPQLDKHSTGWGKREGVGGKANELGCENGPLFFLPEAPMTEAIV